MKPPSTPAMTARADTTSSALHCQRAEKSTPESATAIPMTPALAAAGRLRQQIGFPDCAEEFVFAPEEDSKECGEGVVVCTVSFYPKARPSFEHSYWRIQQLFGHARVHFRANHTNDVFARQHLLRGQVGDAPNEFAHKSLDFIPPDCL